MLDTVLNLGLNDKSVEGLAKKTENDRFAWDSYRRFVQMFGNVCRGVSGEAIEDAIKAQKKEAGVKDDTELSVDDLKKLVDAFKALYKDETDEDFPQDPQDQLAQAIRAVFDSWTGPRAVEYRRINHIPDDWGTAVNVQQMVFGNKGDTSCSGVAFSRDEVTGEPEPSGDFLVNAQGEDVVSGVRTPKDIAEMKDVMPDAHAELMKILRELEAHYKDMQDTEFTVEEGSLYMLQTRNAKRPAQAAVRFAVDAVGEDLLTKAEAITTIDPNSLDALLHPIFDPKADFNVLAKGVAASPGRGQGRDRLHRRRRDRRRRGGPRRHPRPAVHRGRRRRRLPRRQGRPDQRGRQGVARRARRARDGAARGLRRLGARHQRRAEGGPRRRHHAQGGRPDRARRDVRMRVPGRRAAGRAGAQRELRPGARVVATRSASSACAPTPTRPRTRRRPASSAPRASASAAPSTCSWPATASPRCAR